MYFILIKSETHPWRNILLLEKFQEEYLTLLSGCRLLTPNLSNALTVGLIQLVYQANNKRSGKSAWMYIYGSYIYNQASEPPLHQDFRPCLSGLGRIFWRPLPFHQLCSTHYSRLLGEHNMKFTRLFDSVVIQ